jgi:hypothetical protein
MSDLSIYDGGCTVVYQTTLCIDQHFELERKYQKNHGAQLHL